MRRINFLVLTIVISFSSFTQNHVDFRTKRFLNKVDTGIDLKCTKRDFKYREKLNRSMIEAELIYILEFTESPSVFIHVVNEYIKRNDVDNEYVISLSERFGDVYIYTCRKTSYIKLKEFIELRCSPT